MKIHWVSEASVSENGRLTNSKAVAALGLGKHAGTGRLAIVGGGPSIREQVEEIRAFGAVWAVNGAINWCLDHGIDAWFYTADAAPPENWAYDLSRIRKAILAPDVSPEVIAMLLRQGARVELTAPIQSGPTSANASDYVSIEAGYESVTYFGCEGSFEYLDDQPTHAFKSFPVEDWLVVELGGERYRTKAEFISQSIMLSNTIKAFPTIYSERSGGLLRSMIEHGPDYDVWMVSHSLFAKLKDAA